MNLKLSVAINAAKSAGQLIRAGAENLTKLKIEQKSLHDYVSEIDRECESLIANIVRQRFPDDCFLGEEFGSVGSDRGEYQWIVDPLDGTTNFLRAIPHYAVSIAVLRGDEVRHAVVYDPTKEELFTASKGTGAFLNNKPIKVSKAHCFRGALLATGVPFSGQNLEKVRCFTGTMEALLNKHTSGIRRLGVASLDLAYVAAGRFDGFWEANLNVWDIAAGVLLVQEAGGRVTDLCGAGDYLYSGDVIAASPNVIDEMVAVTSQYYCS